MNDAARIGRIVRQLRQQKGITQADLAKQIGWKQPAVCAFEKGKRKVLDVKDVEALARVLHVPPGRLLYGFEEVVTAEEKVNDYLIPQITEQVSRLDPLQKEKVWNIVVEVVSALT